MAGGSNAWMLLTAIAVLPTAHLAAANGLRMAGRQPWMDEVHTLELVSDPDLRRSLSALADGADYNPPAYFQLARAAALVTGDVTVARLRYLSLACVSLGLVAVFLTLRQTVSDAAALTAAVAVWVQSVIIDQCLEARFYAPWFAALAWYCWCVAAADARQPGRLRLLSACLLAAGICTLHYFGVITILLIALGLYFGTRSRIEFLVWLPPACGLLSLAACLPFYTGQRASLAEVTWIALPDLRGVVQFLSYSIPLDAMIIVLPAWWAAKRVRRKANDNQVPSVVSLTRERLGAMAALALLAVVLIMFSFAVQPALVTRYAMVGMLGFAPVIAMLLDGLRRPVIGALCVTLLLLGTLRIQRLSRELVTLDASRTILAETIREHAHKQIVVFENRIDFFPLVWRNKQAAAEWGLLDFEADDLAEPSKLRMVQRDVGRRFARWYPDYKLQPLESLRRSEHFFVVPYPQRGTQDVDYGNFKSQKVADRLFEMTRRQPDHIP